MVSFMILKISYSKLSFLVVEEVLSWGILIVTCFQTMLFLPKLDLCSSLPLKQLIMEPTRVTINCSTLIDLIMTNSSCVSKSGVLHLGISDYSLTYV